MEKKECSLTELRQGLIQINRGCSKGEGEVQGSTSS